jgi:hypothetical protein
MSRPAGVVRRAAADGAGDDAGFIAGRLACRRVVPGPAMTFRSCLAPCCLSALVLLAACRPGDAPKEPVDPNDDDPKVSQQAEEAGGGVHASVARRAMVIARL